MHIVTQVFIALVIAEHFYFLWLEMFVWTTKGPKTFRHIPAEQFAQTKALAANQGLYNGFLAAGLLWTFFIHDALWKYNISLFFLGCVIVAGLYGAYSVSKSIFFIQAFPAIVAMILLLVS